MRTNLKIATKLVTDGKIGNRQLRQGRQVRTATNNNEHKEKTNKKTRPPARSLEAVDHVGGDEL